MPPRGDRIEPMQPAGAGSERKRLLQLLALMGTIALVVAAVAITILYRVALSHQRARLVETVRSQARLMEAMARFDRRHLGQADPEGWRAATLGQIIDAHGHYEGFGRTGELTLARLEDDRIVFLLPGRHSDPDGSAPVPFAGERAEAMRRALSGRSGTVVETDHRGVKVLAAHEPVDLLELGLVAKIDLSEVRSPFVLVGIVTALGALGYVFLGSVLFVRLSRPMIHRMEEREGRIRAILEAAPDAMISIDEQGRIESFNPAAERTFGYKTTEALGASISTLMGSPHKEEHGSYVQRYLETGEARIIGRRREVEGRRKDGTTFPLEISVAEVQAAERRLFIGVAHDLTEQKRAEEELFQARELAMIGELAAKIAHEVKNPLAGISGAIQLLARDLPPGDRKKEMLEEVRSEIRRLDETILDLLRFARPVPPKPRPTDLRSFVSDVVESHRRDEDVARQRIEIEIEENLVVPLDVKHMAQVFTNLLLNAAQAMTEGGTLRIEAGRRGTEVTITVTDTGPGIPEEALGSIFDPFYTTKARGTGLGLSIAKKNVESHGGTLEADIRREAGACFRITLPCE